MLAGISRAFPSLTLTVLLAGCAVDHATDGAAGPAQETDQAVAACEGDDANYDFNAFAASLAVATANELGRWDAAADFEVRNGKLELSATGRMRCQSGCPNVEMLLRLQDDSAGSVPNHSPAVYRTKLTTWHAAQRQKLTELVSRMLRVDKGIYRLKVRHSGKYIVVDGSSYNDGAAVEQRGSGYSTGADQWRVVLEGTKHKFINVRSGKCLALANDSINDGPLVQRTCAATRTQEFEFAGVDSYFTIRTHFAKALDIWGNSLSDDAALTQYQWNGSSQNQHFTLEPVGTGHVSPTAVATAVYTFTARHSGKNIGVASGSMNDGALLEQATYAASDDRFHWYVIRNGDRYQIVNRRSGKCIGLSADQAWSGTAQQTCDANNAGQSFTMVPTGDGYQVLYTKFGSPLTVHNAMTTDGAPITQGQSEWAHHRMFQLKPLLAGEPHRLTYAYKTADATCGEYNFWYNIVKPNGQSLESPHDTWVQLIFAGGKQSATGADLNPFIAQKMTGNLVAIDPTVGTILTETSTSGSCHAACVKASVTSVAGQCCVCQGYAKRFQRSSFSPYAYVCTGN